MKCIQAVFEHGVFRPTEKVDLPESCTVEFEPRVVSQIPVLPPATGRESDHLAKVYAILSQSFETGQRDLAERHNEHQP